IQILMGEITHDTIEWETDTNNANELKAEATKLANKMIKFGISEANGKRLVSWFTMWPKLRRYQKPDKLLQDNEEIPFETNRLRVIWSPGHSLGHICIYDQNKRYLFGGDHILSRITPHIGNFLVTPKYRNHQDFENILDHYLKSLDRIDKLNLKIIFPAHQEVIYNPHERISEIKEKIRDLEFDIKMKLFFTHDDDKKD
ncbi:unnamed protein product, partial [marine sediment metagenome]